MGGNGGNGGEWRIVRNCQKYLVGNVEKMCEIVGKREENGIKTGGNGINFPFSPIPISPFFHSLATFPSGVFDKFCSPN